MKTKMPQPHIDPDMEEVTLDLSKPQPIIEETIDDEGNRWSYNTQTHALTPHPDNKPILKQLNSTKLNYQQHQTINAHPNDDPFQEYDPIIPIKSITSIDTWLASNQAPYWEHTPSDKFNDVYFKLRWNFQISHLQLSSTLGMSPVTLTNWIVGKVRRNRPAYRTFEDMVQMLQKHSLKLN